MMRVVPVETHLLVAVGVFAGRIGAWLRRRHKARRRLDVTTGAIFIGLGVRLGVEQ